MKDTTFIKQARLLLNILPLVKKYGKFALKGGTVINFFVRELPRVSVDIDLTYVVIEDRAKTLKNISQSLEKLSHDVINKLPDINVSLKRNKDTNTFSKLVVMQKEIGVIIEPNLIIRGSVFPIEVRSLCNAAEEKFNLSIRINTLSAADLYGGKICAALDRQHPRDLFDIYFLLNNEGITEKIRKAFIVYLISQPRPIVEILNPRLQDISDIYYKEFEGMTFENVSYKHLIETREHLIKKIKDSLTISEQEFLISFKSLNPNWNLLGLKNIERLPAVKWKLMNIEKMNKAKHQKALEKLKSYLEL